MVKTFLDEAVNQATAGDYHRNNANRTEAKEIAKKIKA